MDARATNESRDHARGRRRYAVRAAVLAIAVLPGPWLDRPALSDPPPPKKLDLTLRLPGNPDTWIRPTFRADGALFLQSNAWAGNAREFIGENTRGWGEFGVVPGLEGQLSLGRSGTLHGRVSGVYSTTQFGLDAAGSNFDDRHPHEITLEDGYVGWRSGDLFPSLGEDAIDLSVGSQSYQAGTGFLFQDGGTDGGERGGYWLGLRKAFRFTGIARLKTGSLLAEAMVLQPNDEPDTDTKVAGANVEYSFGDRATLGGGYWNVFASDDARRDGLHVYDLRAEVQPLRSLDGLGLAGEIVKERNGAENDSWGGTAEIHHDFGDAVPWKPYIAYRYAAFSGDDGKGDNSAFDPLFYGFNDWNQWYLGEILGEYVATNRNLDVHVLHLRANPVELITAHLFYLYFRLDEFPSDVSSRPPTSSQAALIGSRDLAHEIDFIVDWAPNDYLSISAVAASLFPASGARDFFDGGGTWSSFMLTASVKF